MMLLPFTLLFLLTASLSAFAAIPEESNSEDVSVRPEIETDFSESEADIRKFYGAAYYEGNDRSDGAVSLEYPDLTYFFDAGENPSLQAITSDAAHIFNMKYQRYSVKGFSGKLDAQITDRHVNRGDEGETFGHIGETVVTLTNYDYRFLIELNKGEIRSSSKVRIEKK